jgi:hypothetical protein
LGVGGRVLLEFVIRVGDCGGGGIFVLRGLGPIGRREKIGGDTGRNDSAIGISFGERGDVGDCVLALCVVEGSESGS